MRFTITVNDGDFKFMVRVGFGSSRPDGQDAGFSSASSCSVGKG